MNRIILIGNGFDLAHGLKTSYKDFIDDIWNRKRTSVISSHIRYKDDAINICGYKYYGSINYPSNVDGYDWFKKFIDINKQKAPYGVDLVSIEYTNTFLKTISEKSNLKNWVDIEEEYYRELNECLSDKRGTDVEKLNNEFLLIKTELENYLKTQKSSDFKISEKIESNIFSETKQNNFIRKPTNAQLDKFLFLSFNYTNTERLYVQNDSCISDIIHIHGELENPDNPIIFGYGDEIGEEYKNIENKNDNRYLENIKSIKYFETDNYKRLLQFIESGEYQIFIMGHSCGNSDRVLLNMLFEHKNCLSIKIFYHKKDEYTDDFSYVVRNMSRNFTDKLLMRKIVVSKVNSEPLS
jgi:hypothetical protein